MAPHCEHVLEEGNHRSITTSSRPYQSALYSSIVRRSRHAASEMARAMRWFLTMVMPTSTPTARFTGSKRAMVSVQRMALGAIKALGGKAGKQVKVVAFDGTPDGIKAVQAGTLNATVAQQPRLLGKMAVDSALKAARGGELVANAPVPVKIATPENAAQFATQ